MRIKLDINSVAVKQLESAIWMYAYNFDEVAVHTVAGAAFEIYTKRLGLTSFNEDVQKYIKPEKAKEFISLWNMPYNFFKHGEHQYKVLEHIEYDEMTVELVIYLTAEANLEGDDKYRLSCANVFRYYYAATHPYLFDAQFYREHFLKHMEKAGVTQKSLRDKNTLRIWLNSQGHTFLNGTDSPFRDLASH